MADEDKKEVEEKEEAAEEKTDQEEFDEAFDESVADPKAGKEQEETEEKKEEEKEEDKEEEKEEPAEKEEEKEEKEEPQEETDWKAEYDKAQQKMKSWEGRISAANKRAEEEAAAREAAEKKLQERDSTQAKSKEEEALPGGEDDDQVLKDFMEEFPSLEKPIKALARKIASKIVDDKIKDIEPKIAQVSQKIEPIERKIKEDKDVEHFDKISSAHSDWKDIRDSGKLTKWIETQPKIVRVSLERVVREGSTDEVIEMFDLYKGSSKSTDQSTTPRGKSPSKKAQDLLAVDSSPSGTPKGKGKLDKDDFDAGWDEALRD